jgi:hypothetical protein
MSPVSGAADSSHDGHRHEEMSVAGPSLDSGLRPLARALIELAIQLTEEQQPDDEEKTA